MHIKNKKLSRVSITLQYGSCFSKQNIGLETVLQTVSITVTIYLYWVVCLNLLLNDLEYSKMTFDRHCLPSGSLEIQFLQNFAHSMSVMGLQPYSSLDIATALSC